MELLKHIYVHLSLINQCPAYSHVKHKKITICSKRPPFVSTRINLLN